MSRKFKFHYNLARITSTSHEDQYTFLITYRSFLRRMKNISGKSCREYQNTHFTHNGLFRKNRDVYEIMWKNTLEPDRPQMTIWRMRITGWTPMATNTHSEYVILISFPLQQLLHEGASMLRYAYIACLVQY
jgi:hypothetical protein